MTNGTDPIDQIQQLIDTTRDYYVTNNNAGNMVIAVGVVTPDAPQGQFLFTGPTTLNSASDPSQTITLDEMTLFEIASCSKLFTSGIYYMLQHGDYMGTLGDKIGPLKSSPIASIAIEDIAFYQSGLPQDNDGKVYSNDIFRDLATLFHYWDSHSWTYPPGTCYTYSNMSWSLMAMAALELDNTETKAFVNNFNTQLQAFFNMGSGLTQAYSDTLLANIPAAYGSKWNPLAAADYQPCPLVRYGSGGIVSNLNDMLLFLLFNMGQFSPNKAMLTLQQKQAISSNSCSGGSRTYTTGHAWFHQSFETQNGSVDVLWKDGGAHGFTSWIGFPNWVESGTPAQNGVVVLTNTHVADCIGHQAMNILLGISTQACDAQAVAASIARINYETPD
jgi:CubicO group peptidase (beta-lactamase class C family)